MKVYMTYSLPVKSQHGMPICWKLFRIQHTRNTRNWWSGLLYLSLSWT